MAKAEEYGNQKRSVGAEIKGEQIKIMLINLVEYDLFHILRSNP